MELSKQARILMGVKKKYHDTTLGPGLALKVVDSLRNPGISQGVETVEIMDLRVIVQCEILLKY